MKKSTSGKQGIVTMISITVVNILNYGLNLCLGRFLGPEGFAEANVIATIVLIISFLGIAVQLMLANEVARSSSEGRKSALRWLEERILKISFVLMFFIMFLSKPISNYLHLSSTIPILLIALSIPLYFLLCSRRGYFQGCQDFKSFSTTFLVETFARLGSTLGLLYLAQQYSWNWNTEIIAFGFLFSFLAAAVYSIKKVKLKGIKSQIRLEKKSLLVFMSIIIIYELSQILINNFDVILIKHYFDDLQAGLYSSIALVGRIVFFGTWTIVTLLFPKVIEKEKKGEPHHQLFYSALGLVLVGGLLITLSCALFDELIISILFGEQFAETSHLLWKYALATALFASANVFAYYYMSLQNYLPVFLSLLMGMVQIYLIYIYHSTLNEVVSIQLLCMSILLGKMLTFHLLKSTISLRKNSEVLKTSFST